MSPDRSRDASTLHEGALETLTTQLIEAGFTPRAGDRHEWVGPVHPSLSAFTTATEMRLEIRDGWPYQHPYLFVEGLTGRRHVNADGNVCLWDENDDRYHGWLSLGEIQARIRDWSDDQAAGAADPPLDAHLYFSSRNADRLVVFDLDELGRRKRLTGADGDHGRLEASLARGVYRVDGVGPLRVAWYRRAGLAAPPTNITAFRKALTRSQNADFGRFLTTLSRSRPSLALLLWDDGPATNALAIQLRAAGQGSYLSTAIEVARTDASIMRLRAGPDAPRLGAKRVTICGIGAIGSEIARLLAQSGVGHLVLIDFELLRPGNLTRHAASGRYVGQPKVEAVRQTLNDALPHIDVVGLRARLWDPGLAKLAVDTTDLVIDATGNRAYADMLGRIAQASDRPLIAAALYRGGAIARLSVQSRTTCPIFERGPANGFPEVPADPVAPSGPQLETGCGAPVNNAPPWAVAAASALAARTAIDALCGRIAEDMDIVEVYEPIADAPFDIRGIREFRPSTDLV